MRATMESRWMNREDDRPRGARRTGRRAAVLGLVLALGACQPAPSAAPATIAPSGGPNPSGPASPGPTASAPAGDALGDQLRAAISIEDILADLDTLAGIAAANGGARVAGSAGHDASAELVAEELRAAGYAVELVPATIPTFRVDAPTVLEILAAGAPPFEDSRDVKPMLLSPSGDVTAKVFPLGFDPEAPPGSRGGSGCDPADWAAAPAGVVALVQPGSCRRRDVIVNAQEAGALAIVTAYPEWTADRVLRPTLVDPNGLTIPAVGATHGVGLALFAASGTGADVHLRVSTTVEVETTMNVIAETPGGDPGNVVMLGGHLDSVVDGPGINDNGSGTMAVLEIARELAALRPDGAPWKVRVAFWTGEETGLLGSADYVGRLDAEEVVPLRAYLNFDMLGSLNGVRQVYDGSIGTRPIAGAFIQGLFTAALDEAGLAWELVEVGAASDHFPFDQLGVPVGGLFSGANERKTLEQAARFGGTADAPNDPCYHLLCDTRANIDPVLLEQLARIAAWVAGELASGKVVIPAG
jgi:hypothetical protein